MSLEINSIFLVPYIKTVMRFCLFSFFFWKPACTYALVLLMAASAIANTSVPAANSSKPVANAGNSANPVPPIGAVGALYYKDGNRITGKLVAVNPRVWIVDSDRFGRLTVPRTESDFIAVPENADFASMPETVEDLEHIVSLESEKARSNKERAEEALIQDAATAHPAPHTEDVEPSDESKSPLHLPSWVEWVGNYVRPWKGRLSGFAWTGQDSGEQRTEYYVSLNTSREWEKDRFEADLRYDFRKRSGILDKRRATARSQYRHRFTPKWFFTYIPYIEYDGYYDLTGRVDYLLTQQQVGTGYYLIEREKLASTVALTYNFFAIDTIGDGINSEGAWVPALKLDNRVSLPWSFEFAQRGQLFFLDLAPDSVGTGFGIENEMEIRRKFTNNFSLTLRHEYRIDYPALNSNDYDRMRLLFNYEF